MYCSKCGTELTEKVNFCPRCGNAIENPATTENFSQAPANPNPYSTVSTPRPVQKAKPNPFAFVSAGIMGFMLVLYFCPWFFIHGTITDVFGYYIDHMPLAWPDDTAAILFLTFSFIGTCMLVLGIIAAFIRKRRVPVLFAIIASASIQISLVFFLFTKEVWTIGVSAVPLLIFLLTFVNIAFAILAKIK